MTTADTTAGGAKAGWVFWLVAGLSLLWNAFGGYDYTMSHLQGEAYYRQAGMTDAQIAYMQAFPVWMHAVWAIGVWGSVLGSILLLLRSRWALHAFVASFAGAAISLVQGLTVGLEANGGAGAAFSAVIVAICGLLAWFAWTMTKRGILR